VATSRLPLALRAGVLLAAFSLVPAVCTSEPVKPGAEPTAGRVDRYGDPLPPGAIARIGCARLRHGLVSPILEFSPDGKTLATSNETVRLWEVGTGRLLRELPAGRLAVRDHAFSPGGRRFVTTQDDQVRLWDLRSGKLLALRPDKDSWGVATDVAFSPDGRTLAVLALFCAPGDAGAPLLRIHLCDAESLDELAVLQPRNVAGEISGLTFSPDGKRLAFGTGQGLQLWDVAGRKEVASLKVEGGVYRLAFAPDGRTVVVHQYGTPVSLLEVPSGKVVLTTRVVSYSSADLRFTPDGKSLLFAPGEGPVLAIDPTGASPPRELLRVARGPRPMVALSPDGKHVAVGAEGVIRIWDLTTGRESPVFDDHREGEGIVAVPSPDGRRLATLSRTELRVWELRTGQMLRRIPGKGFLPGLRWTQDGWQLVVGEADTVGWWDVDTGKQLRKVAVPPRKWEWISPSGEGGLLLGATKGEKGVTGFRLLDATTGRERLLINRAGPEGEQVEALSPDGKSCLAVKKQPGKGGVRLRDAATGRTLWEPAAPSVFGPACFSADGRAVAMAGRLGVQVWATDTGRELGHQPGEEDLANKRIGAVCLSPDGRTAAVACFPVETEGARPGMSTDVGAATDYLLIEITTNRVRRALPRIEGTARGTFTHDGRHLVTGSTDGTGLVWETYPAPPVPVKPLSPDDADQLWEVLAGADAGKAFDAICRLVASPAEAVELVGTRLKPAGVDREKVKRLLPDLAAEEFDTREAATRELAALGEDIEPLLREALKAGPLLETRRRIEGLLRRLEGKAGGPEGWRRTRALEALEHIGTPEARRLLETLSRGDAASRLTAEAQASLERLGKGIP
jgi:WD40 repeat protein